MSFDINGYGSLSVCRDPSDYDQNTIGIPLLNACSYRWSEYPIDSRTDSRTTYSTVCTVIDSGETEHRYRYGIHVVLRRLTQQIEMSRICLL
jgi:hypothetical protein